MDKNTRIVDEEVGLTPRMHILPILLEDDDLAMGEDNVYFSVSFDSVPLKTADVIRDLLLDLEVKSEFSINYGLPIDSAEE